MKELLEAGMIPQTETDLESPANTAAMKLHVGKKNGNCMNKMDYIRSINLLLCICITYVFMF